MPRASREPSAAQLAAREAGAARLREANANRRTQPTRSRRNDHTPSEDKIGQELVRKLPSTGKARLETEGSVQVVDRVVDKDWAKNMQFAEDVLTILVHESNDPNADPIPYVINDGKRQAFIRGQEQEVKRKYVEILARMKVVTQTQVRYKDTQNIDAIKMIPHTALRYPFTVIRDPSPRGKAWLDAIRQEP